MADRMVSVFRLNLSLILDLPEAGRLLLSSPARMHFEVRIFPQSLDIDQPSGSKSGLLQRLALFRPTVPPGSPS